MSAPYPWRGVPIAWLLTLSLSAIAGAQTTGGTIDGVVKDPDARAVPGVPS